MPCYVFFFFATFLLTHVKITAAQFYGAGVVRMLYALRHANRADYADLLLLPTPSAADSTENNDVGVKRILVPLAGKTLDMAWLGARPEVRAVVGTEGVRQAFHDLQDTPGAIHVRVTYSFFLFFWFPYSFFFFWFCFWCVWREHC